MAGATSFLDFPTHPLRHVVLVWLRALLRDAGDQQVVPLCDIVLSIEHLDELGHHFRNHGIVPNTVLVAVQLHVQRRCGLELVVAVKHPLNADGLGLAHGIKVY